jgi:protein-disulfide isomerase
MTNIFKRDPLTPLAIILAGILISGSILWANQRFVETIRQTSGALSDPGSPPGPSASTDPPNIAKVSVAGEPFIGKENAPVVMAYWFDYQCPFCRRLEEQVMPQLIADYVETGKLKIVFKDYAFLGPDSETAGLAARAVWEIAPEKFAEWHKAMFDKQDDENAGWGNKDDILALTRTISGIDTAKVEELMTSNADKYRQVISADGQEGAGMGVTGTPGAIIGTQLLVGAQPYAQFKAAIDAVLNDTGNK